MSTYCNQQMIQGAIQNADLISLTDDDQTGQLNTTVLNQVITNASGQVDMYCANIYGTQLPFSDAPATPQSVANLALTIACYMLYERRETPHELNKFAKRYDAAIAMLEKINTGDMHLNDVPFRDFAQVAFTARGNGGIYGVQGSNQPATSM